MRGEDDLEYEEIVELLMARLHGFAHGLGLDEAKARQIVEQVITDMPLHTDDERLEWAWNWMRAASGQ